MSAQAAEIFRRLSALDLSTEAFKEVLSIIADCQSGDEARKAKDRERKRLSKDIPRNIPGTSTEIPGTVSQVSPPIDNITLTPSSSLSAERAARATPRSILLECLSAEMADAVIDHRRAKRSPLTLKAAQLLVKGFLATGQPEAAAEMMIERGWTALKPAWFEREKSDGRNGKQSVQAAARGLIERGVDFGPIPPAYLPARRSGPEIGNPPRLLSQGGRGGAGDLRGSGGLGAGDLSAGDSLSGDGPADWHSGQEPMASNGR